MIEAGDAGFTRDGFLVSGGLLLLRESGEVMAPCLGPHFQPAFPVGSPRDFLEELFRRAGAVLFQHRAGTFLFRDEACADVRREAGNAIVFARAEIEVPMPGVSDGMRDEAL